jgi:hypothetical protein
MKPAWCLVFSNPGRYEARLSEAIRSRIPTWRHKPLFNIDIMGESSMRKMRENDEK